MRKQMKLVLLMCCFLFGLLVPMTAKAEDEEILSVNVSNLSFELESIVTEKTMLLGNENAVPTYQELHVYADIEGGSTDTVYNLTLTHSEVGYMGIGRFEADFCCEESIGKYHGIFQITMGVEEGTYFLTEFNCGSEPVNINYSNELKFDLVFIHDDRENPTITDVYYEKEGEKLDSGSNIRQNENVSLVVECEDGIVPDSESGTYMIAVSFTTKDKVLSSNVYEILASESKISLILAASV